MAKTSTVKPSFLQLLKEWEKELASDRDVYNTNIPHGYKDGIPDEFFTKIDLTRNATNVISQLEYELLTIYREEFTAWLKLQQ